MRFSFTTAVAILASASYALPTSSAETPASIARSQLENRATDPRCTATATDRLIFEVSIVTFLRARNAQLPSLCNWHSDNCSKSPDRPNGLNFIPSCQRHDFGYRNTKSQRRFTRTMKMRIDDNFKKDLYKYCSHFSGWSSWRGVECRRIADVYVAAVRRFGKREDGMEFDDEVTMVGKREEGPVQNLDEFDGSQLDPDIPGQVIPEVLDNDGIDVDDLDAFLAG